MNALVPHLPGIYSITCIVNMKIYIGSSLDIGKRFQHHRAQLRSNKHFNQKLQRAWNKYCESSFVFGIVEFGIEGQKNLLMREQYWLDFYKAYDDTRGYNIALEARAAMKGRRHSESTIELYRKSRKGSKNPNWRPYKEKVCPYCGVCFRTKSGNTEKFCSQKCYHAYMKQHRTDDTKFKMGSYMRGRRRTSESLEKAFNKRAKKFIVIDPGGTVYNVFGLARFCREHSLDQGTMSNVSLGLKRSYKGWICKREI